jgi:putative Holliday junction resolvase
MMTRALGIDHGDARLGLALSDELGMLAHPLETLAAGPKALPRIQQILREKAVETIVLGLPKNMDGSKGAAAQKVEAFAQTLREAAPNVRLVLWDERMSTLGAQRQLHEAGRDAKSSKAVIDQVAAQIILQSWLDAQSFQAPPL